MKSKVLLLTTTLFLISSSPYLFNSPKWLLFFCKHCAYTFLNLCFFPMTQVAALKVQEFNLLYIPQFCYHISSSYILITLKYYIFYYIASLILSNNLWLPSRIRALRFPYFCPPLPLTNQLLSAMLSSAVSNL